MSSVTAVVADTLYADSTQGTERDPNRTSRLATHAPNTTQTRDAGAPIWVPHENYTLWQAYHAPKTMICANRALDNYAIGTPSVSWQGETFCMTETRLEYGVTYGIDTI